MELKYCWLGVMLVQLAVMVNVQYARALPLSELNLVSPVAIDDNYAVAKCPYLNPFCNQPAPLQLVPSTGRDLNPSVVYTGYPDEAVANNVNIPRSMEENGFRSKRFFSILSPSERLRVLYYRSRARQGANQDTSGEGPPSSSMNSAE